MTNKIIDMNATAVKHCKLLELPAELRDRIYDYLFEPTLVSMPDKVDLFDAHLHLPSSSISLTCQQLYKETVVLCKTSQDHFWRTSRFTILVPKPKWRSEAKEGCSTYFVNKCSGAQVAGHIQRLEVTVQDCWGDGGKTAALELWTSGSLITTTRTYDTLEGRSKSRFSNIYYRGQAEHEERVTMIGCESKLDASRIVRLAAPQP